MEGKITVFIVEDDEALAKELESYLMRWNYDAVVAKEFERISEEFQDCRPHIVLLDVNLPYYDGFYWCRKIPVSYTHLDVYKRQIFFQKEEMSHFIIR